MTNEQFDALVGKLEEQARRNSATPILVPLCC